MTSVWNQNTFTLVDAKKLASKCLHFGFQQKNVQFRISELLKTAACSCFHHSQILITPKLKIQNIKDIHRTTCYLNTVMACSLSLSLSLSLSQVVSLSLFSFFILPTCVCGIINKRKKSAFETHFFAYLCVT
jgi:hypothetical protein